MLILKRHPRKKSRLDSIHYTEHNHTLVVRMYEQTLTYIGIPESLYARLFLADTPDAIFMNEIFNKYPVVVSDDPKPIRLPVKRKAKAR